MLLTKYINRKLQFLFVSLAIYSILYESVYHTQYYIFFNNIDHSYLHFQSMFVANSHSFGHHKMIL